MLKTIPLSSHSPLAVISGTSGITAQAIEEREFINKIASKTAIRALGTMLGHGVEAQFPAGIALAAMALNKGQFYPPFDASGTEQPFTGNLQQALVTCWGNWRGEGLALVEAV
jgi:3-oxoacyl-[acyl-carrier-protein] synthase II